MPRGREHGHVDTDLGDQDPGGNLTDARHRQQMLEGPVERDGLRLDVGVDGGDVGVDLVDVIQVHSQQDRVMLTEPAA